MKDFFLSFMGGSAIASFFFLFIAAEEALSQPIIPDQTLGAESSRLVQDGDRTLILDGAERGANLFHSFSRFGVLEGEQTYFLVDDGIQNILARVTGNRRSTINGMLGVEGSANLFLLNPNGITFGYDAELDLRGSLVVSTANAVAFEDEVVFGSFNTDQTLLTVSTPIGLQLGATPGRILVRSFFERSNAQTISFIGGDVTLDESVIDIPKGKIFLGALSDVEIEMMVQNDSVNFTSLMSSPGQDIRVFSSDLITSDSSEGGDIKIVGGKINIQDSFLESGALVEGDAGSIFLKSDQSIVVENSDLTTFSSSVGDGGKITINANQIDIIGSFLETDTAEGKAGEINLSSPGLVKVENSSLITYSDREGGSVSIISGRAEIAGLEMESDVSKGQAGSLIIDSQESILIKDSDVYLGGFGDGIPGKINLLAEEDLVLDKVNFILSKDDGDAGGDFSASAREIIVANGTIIETSVYGNGNAGAVRLNAQEQFLMSKGSSISTVIEPGAKGLAGNIAVNANSIYMSQESSLQSTVGGQGKGGQITLFALNELKLEEGSFIDSEVKGGGIGIGGNISATSENTSIINSSVSTSLNGIGQAGEVNLRSTGSVYFLNSIVFTDTREGSIGNGGDINIDSGFLTIEGDNGRSNGFTSGTDGLGDGGDININVEKTMKMINSEPGSVAIFSIVSPNGNGNSGKITIDSESLFMSRSALINGTTGIGDVNDITLNIDEDFVIFDGGIYSNVGGVGDGGTLRISANHISLLNGAQLFLSTDGGGDAGDIEINARDKVKISGIRASGRSSSLYSSSELGATGDAGAIYVRSPILLIDDRGVISARTLGLQKGGDILIDVEQLELNGGGQIIASTLAEGQAGNIEIKAAERISVSGYDTDYDNRILTSAPINIDTRSKESGLFTDSGSRSSLSAGRAGNISLETPFLSVDDTAKIAASTQGVGDSGDISIQSVNSAILLVSVGDRASVGEISGEITTETLGSGKGGNISLAAPEVIQVSGNGMLNAQTSSTGSAGNITVTTDRFTLDQGTRLTTTATETASPPANTIEPSANININANEMNLFGTVQVLSETRGQAQAGTLALQPKSSENLIINLKDNSRASASTSSRGAGGNLSVSAPNLLKIRGNGVLSAETSGSGPAGTVRVKSQQFVLQDGAQLSTSTSSSGQGGTLQIDVGDRTFLQNEAKLIAQSTGTASGKAGNLTLNTGLLELDNASITVRSTGTGDGGDIRLNARQSLRLSNQGLIETDAGGSGNGGNIFVNTPFLIGSPKGNGDIIANAIGGDGGRIEIEAQNIFNFEQRDGQNRLQLRNNTTNDISASSETGRSGVIALDTLNTNPGEGLSELPVDLVDPTSLIDRRCELVANPHRTSRFTHSSRFGIPTHSTQVLQDEVFHSDLGPDLSLSVSDKQLEASHLSYASASPRRSGSDLKAEAIPVVLEAQQWSKTVDGNVRLLAAQPVKPPAQRQVCSAHQKQ